MPTFRRPLAAAAIVTALAGATAAPLAAQTYPGATLFNAQNLVTNGDFEATPVTSGTHLVFSGDPTQPYWGSAPPATFGWRVTGSVDVHNFDRSGWIRTPNGAQTLELNGSAVPDMTVYSGVWQEIATTAGARYTLQFLLSGWQSTQAELWWNGAVVTGSPSTGATTNRVGSTSDGFWVWEFRDLVATGPVTTLGFRTLIQNSQHGPVIDDVRLYAQPMVTPEPASVLLLGGGLAALAVVQRRRRRA